MDTLKLIDFEDYLAEEYGAIGTPERTKYEAEVTADMTELQQKVAEEQVETARRSPKGQVKSCSLVGLCRMR